MIIKFNKFVFGRKKANAFSILELVIVLSISLILLSIGLPSFKQFYQDQELMNSSQAWLNLIRSTRYLAIKTQRPATLHWQNTYSIEQQNQVIHEIHSISSHLQVHFQASFARDDELTFLPNGFTQGQQGHFTLCLTNTQKCRKIVVLSSGIARLEDQR